jgi:hypothetical protein
MPPPTLLADIREAIQRLGIEVSILEPVEARLITDQVSKVFGRHIIYYPINLGHGDCIKCLGFDHRTRIFGDIIKHICESYRTPGFLIVDIVSEAHPIVLMSLSWKNLERVIEEMYPFPYFIVDDTSSFLLCENIHEMFCGLGAIRSYIAAMDRIEPRGGA